MDCLDQELRPSELFWIEVQVQRVFFNTIIEDFVRLLHTSYGVKLVCVCQTLRRDNAPVFNSKVGLLTRYLRVVLEPLPYAIFWGHKGFWKAQANFYVPDGVHLNGLGQYKLYKSLRGAVLRSLRLLHRTPNWGVDCVLAYNSVILCHFICCDTFYRAFDLVLLHYSFVLLSLMSCLDVLSLIYELLIVLSLISCLIVLSFMSCLMYSSLWAVWFRSAIWAVRFHSVSIAVWLHWLWLFLGETYTTYTLEKTGQHLSKTKTITP